MPYKSEKQRRFMHAKHPDIAARWDAEYGGTVQPKKENRRGRPSARLHRKRRKS